jgi:hypothetical protein
MLKTAAAVFIILNWAFGRTIRNEYQARLGVPELASLNEQAKAGFGFALLVLLRFV